MPIEAPVVNHSSAAAANRGESYVSLDGSEWEDLIDEVPGANVCIKAYSEYRAPNVSVQAERRSISGWIINREYGSGTRYLLDHIFSKKGINPARIMGYNDEVFTHLEVGLAVLKNAADAGLGIKAVASQLGLEFLPLCKERYDLAILADYLTLNQVQDFLKILQSDIFRSNIKAVPGYDIKDMGKIIH